MANEGINRKLAAILSADVAGYSRLMSEDEVETLQRLKTYRELISVRIKEHRGRVVDNPGDNILVEFPSALDAMRCAVEIQHSLKNRNADLPKSSRMEFRIGIHLGDVITDGSRLYGDGVNIAARLEKLSPVTGICLSDIVYSQVKGKLDLEFEDIGEKNVKNINTPIHAFQILLGHGVANGTEGELKPRPSPDKPAIAVLAFENMSSDPEQEYFSDGISEDILNGLAHISWVDVIARTSSFQYKGQNRDIRDIGKQLNATHILEGSVRKYGSKVRITAQLIDANLGTHVFSEQYDRDLANIFALQAEISDAVLKALNIHQPNLTKYEMHTSNTEAYDAYLMARNCVYSGLLDEAIKTHGKAVALDPNYSTAYGALAGTHNSFIWWNRLPASIVFPIVSRYCSKALSLNPYQADALYVRAEIRFYAERAYQEAIDEMAILLRMYPNSISILMHYGFILQTLGQFDMTSKIYDRMMSLDPLNPTAHLLRGSLLMRIGDLVGAHKSLKQMDMLGLHEPGMLAELALYKDDIQDIQNQVDLGESNWGNLRDWHPFYKASALHLKGENERADKLFAALLENRERKYSVTLLRSIIASVKGNIETSVEYMSEDLSETAYVKFREIQTPCFYLKLFPDYRSNPRYQKMLKDVGLDEESIAKLKIPPLPF